MLLQLELSFSEYPGVFEFGKLADPSVEVGAWLRCFRYNLCDDRTTQPSVHPEHVEDLADVGFVYTSRKAIGVLETA